MSDKHSGGFRGVCGGLIYTCTGFDNGGAGFMWIQCVHVRTRSVTGRLLRVCCRRLLDPQREEVFAAGLAWSRDGPAVRGCVCCGLVREHDQTRSERMRLLRVCLRS